MEIGAKRNVVTTDNAALRLLANANAAGTPNNTPNIEDNNANLILTQSESKNGSYRYTRAYHFKEKPSIGKEIKDDEVKDTTITTNIGANINSIAKLTYSANI